MVNYLTYAQIDIDKIKNNIKVIKKSIGNNCKLLIVVKGNAYGHGLIPFIKEIENYKEVDYIAVATLVEVKKCINAKFSKPILILNIVPVIYLDDLNKNLDKIILSVYNFEHARDLNEYGIKHNIKLNVHIRIDLYKNGKGMTIEEYQSHEKEIYKLKGLNIQGIYSHIYSAYSFEEKYIEDDLDKFDNFVNSIESNIRKNLTIHISTSVMLFKYPKYYYDMVRVGAAAYGLPINNTKDKYKGLIPIMEIKGHVVGIQQLTKTSYIDYENFSNSDFKNRKIAQVSFGHWDAPKIMDSKTVYVNINGKVTKLIGEPCMDSCCIDIEGIDNVKVNTEVILLGDYEGVTLDDKIRDCGLKVSNCQYMFAGMERIPKIYISKNTKEYLLNQVLSNAPTLKNMMKKYRKYTLIEYLKKIKMENDIINYKDNIFIENNSDLEEVVFNYLKESVDEDKAKKCINILKQTKTLHTANHFGIDYLPQSVQGNMLYYKWLTLYDENVNVVPIFACATVPMRSENFPRGILNYYSLSEKKIIKTPVFPDKERSVMVGCSKGFTKEMILKVKKHYEKNLKNNSISYDTYIQMMKILSEYEKDDILKKTSFIEQGLLINEILYRNILKDTNISYLYIPIEQIVAKLLIKDLQNNKSLINKILWNKEIRNDILNELNNCVGCWNNASLSKIKDWNDKESSIYYVEGTHFFWGVDNKNIRYPLYIYEEDSKLYLIGVTSYNDKVKFEFTREKLIIYIKENKIFSNIFITFIEIYFTRNYSVIGGCFQETYLKVIRDKLAHVLIKHSFFDTGNYIKYREGLFYMSGLIFLIKNFKENCAVPMGLAEILEDGGFTEKEFDDFLNITYYKSHEFGLFNFYTDIVPKNERNLAWFEILQKNIRGNVT